MADPVNLAAGAGAPLPLGAGPVVGGLAVAAGGDADGGGEVVAEAAAEVPGVGVGGCSGAVLWASADGVA